MKVVWAFLSVTAMLVAGALAFALWTFWPLIDPQACAKAEQALRAQAAVVASLPRALTAEVEQTNGCDSGDGGYTVLYPEPHLGFTEIDRLLGQASWSPSDGERSGAYEKHLDGETWHLVVEQAQYLYLQSP